MLSQVSGVLLSQTAGLVLAARPSPEIAEDVIGISIVAIVLLALLVVPIVCAALVYSDAKKRGLSAGLWALFVFFTTIIGVIVYLLARPSDVVLCGNCGAQLRNGFVACPNCGARSARTCPSCNRKLEAGWRVCPYCGAEAEGAGAAQAAPPIVTPRPVKAVSGLAVAALVITLLGPVGWTCLGGLFAHVSPFWPLSALAGMVAIPLAFVLSIAAIVSIRNNPDRLSGAWMAWLAFVINLLEIAVVTIAIVAGGLAIFLPAIERMF